MEIQEIGFEIQKYFDTNNYKEAETFLSSIIAANQTSESACFALYMLGRMRFYQGNYNEAKKYFIRAVKYNKNDVYVKFFLARTLHLTGEVDDALKLYSLCGKSKPDLPICCAIHEILSSKSFQNKELTSLLDDKDRIEKPVVSIIILCYNKMEYTEQCLKSLFANTVGPSYEVIVADNASADNTPALLEMFSKKIKYIHFDSNTGFVAGNNMAVEHVEGDYIVFLNNDTMVEPDWLTELHNYFGMHPRSGAVGSMLIYPDMKLQEAGGIIFNNATGWNYGKGSEINDPRFQFAREVDYCSGAALMVKKELFLKLGRFDNRFAPAYCEDTDLCFSIRKLGYKVMYCPTSHVIHFEGVTAGTDLTSGIKKYQLVNQVKFKEKWQKELRLQYPSNPELVYHFSNRRAGKRILFIDDLPPLPDRAAGSLRLYHTVRQMLGLGYQITYVHLTGSNLGGNADKYLKKFRSAGVEFIWFNYESWWAIRNSAEVKPHLASLINSLELKKRKFDFIYICFWYIADYFIDYIRQVDPIVPILIDSMDLHYLREGRQAEALNHERLKEKAFRTKIMELEVYSKADCVTTVTERDRNVLKQDLLNKPIFIMTDVHDPVETINGFDQRKDFLYVGNFNHNPNEDAVLYFVKGIYPLIKKEIPEAKFLVVGNNPTEKVKALSSTDIIVTGWVPEVRPYLEKCRVSVVPLRFGAGNKGKVGETLSYGLPMVSTTIGAEGMNIINEVHAFVADDPRKFADYAIRLYENKEIWETLSVKGKDIVTGQYTSEMMRKRIEYITSFKTRTSLKSYRALHYPTPPTVSIMVIASGSENSTRKCLNSIRNSTAVSHETFLVSTTSYERAIALGNGYPELRLLKKQDYTYSYPDSLNRAFSNALGAYVVVIKDVTELADRWIENMIECAETSDKVGIVTASDTQGVTCTLVKQIVLKKIGGLDAGIKSGNLYADMDFFLRAKLAGFKIESVEGAAIRGKKTFEKKLDNDLFVNKWGIPISAVLQESGVKEVTQRDIVYPINKDVFIENFERALISKRENEGMSLLLYLERAVKAFHGAERNGYSIEFPELLNMAGEEALAENELAKATEYFEEAVALTPYYREAVMNYGIMLMKAKKSDKASRVLDKFLERQPEDREIKQLLMEIRSLPSNDNVADIPKGNSLLVDSEHITSEPLTSIIILTHNQLEHTKLCIESILRHTPEPHELIVVDNASTDGTVEYLKSLMSIHADIRVISNSDNRGFAAGNNQGISIAKGKYVLLLNNDTVVTEGWLSRMLSVFNKHAKTGIIGPMSNYVSGPQLVPEVTYKNLDEMDVFANQWRKEHNDQSLPIYRVVGFCLLTKKEVLDKIGGLDERFGSGNFEDDDFCIRAALAGFESRIAQDVFIHHAGSQTFKGEGIDFSKSLRNNWELFKSKWGLPLDAPYGTPYQFPAQIPQGVSIFSPIPDISSDHKADTEKRWWADEGHRKTLKERQMGLTSIIVPVSSNPDYTKKCISSIKKHTPEPHEIVLIDNSYSSKTSKWLKKQVTAEANLRLIDGNADTSYTKASNLGLQECSGEFVLILTDDVVVTEGWLSGMLECLRQAPDVGIVGPMTVNIEGPQKVGQTDYTSLEYLDKFAVGFREQNRFRRVPSRNLRGFCLLFRHDIVQKIGLFDESFENPYAFADEDYCLRASAEGYGNMIAADVFIHHHSNGFAGSKAEHAKAVAANKKLFNNKWSSVDQGSQLWKKLMAANALYASDELFQKGQAQEGVDTLIEAMKINPDDRRLHFAVAGILVENGNYQEAFELLQKMPESIKDDIYWHTFMGHCSLEKGLFEDAEEHAVKALALDCTSPKALNLKGLIAFKKGNLREAEESFREAIQSDQSFGEAYANLGGIRWSADENKDEAFNLLERSFILSPTVEDIVINYHAASVSLSRLDRAERIFKDAMALHPKNKRIKFILVDILLQLEKFSDAMDIVQDALLGFGVDENTFTLALALRDKLGTKEVDQNAPDTISLCMILKNEERNIGKCLHSLKPLVDEIIVVDTGSTDRTKDLAKIFGAKVYDFAWTDDFSEARNYSLSKACGKWILVLDADETISPSDFDELRKIVRKSGSKLIAHKITTRNYLIQVSVGWLPNDGIYAEEAGTGWFPSRKVRLFPNDSRIRFEHPVHELVEPSLERLGVEVKECAVPVHHYGKLDLTKITSKGEDYYMLGKKKLDGSGEDDPKALFELAQQASELERYDDALVYVQKVVSLNPSFPKAMVLLGNTYSNLHRYEEARSAFEKALQIDPKSTDAAILYATSELILGNVDSATELLEDLNSQFPSYPMIMLGLTVAYFLKGRKESAHEFVKKLQETNFSCSKYLSEFVKAKMKRSDYRQAMTLLEAAIETGNTDDETEGLIAECKKRIEHNI